MPEIKLQFTEHQLAEINDLVDDAQQLAGSREGQGDIYKVIGMIRKKLADGTIHHG